jgi:hypothetical protein
MVGNLKEPTKKKNNKNRRIEESLTVASELFSAAKQLSVSVKLPNGSFSTILK